MSAGTTRVSDLLDEAVRTRVTPGAALLVGRGSDVLSERYVGRVSEDEAEDLVDADTVYDLSSLTKPLATAAIAMMLVEQGALSVDDRVADRIRGFEIGDPRRGRVTVRDLLSHTSGLPAHRAYFELHASDRRSMALIGPAGTRAGKHRIEALAVREPLVDDPGKSAVYSDIGFIALGYIVEERAGAPLDVLFRERIAEVLGLRSIGFVDLEAPRPSFVRRAAACGACSWRGVRVRGEVQDENAWAMGGVAGHAGLFGTARDVHAVVAEHVNAWRGGPSLLAHDVVREFWRVDERVSGSTRTLGWDSPSQDASSAGDSIGSPAVGHLGYTGTSVWIDLQRGVHVILLTNRLEVSRDNTAIRTLRPRLHDAVFAALDEEQR